MKLQLNNYKNFSEPPYSSFVHATLINREQSHLIKAKKHFQAHMMLSGL